MTPTCRRPSKSFGENGRYSQLPIASTALASIPEVLRGYTIESLTETGVDDVVGQWAHTPTERGLRHWFVIANKAD